MFYDNNVKEGLLRRVILYFVGRIRIDLVYLKYNFKVCIKSLLIFIFKIYFKKLEFFYENLIGM